MTPSTKKAGPVATGTDLRNSDLAIKFQNSKSSHFLQVSSLTKSCAIAAAMRAAFARKAVLR